MSIEDPELLFEIKTFINLQSSLVSCFRNKYREVADCKFMFEVPKYGNIICNGISWKFSKHGMGIQFINDNQLTVDIHKNFALHPTAIDAHRLSIFLESKLRLKNAENLFNFCESKLKHFASANELVEVENLKQLYVLI